MRGHQRPLDELKGVVEGIRFRSEESGFTVVVAKVEGEERTIVGELATSIEKGAKFVAHGRWWHDRKHGQQFRFEHLQVTAPTTADQVIARLMTYPGIGESTAEKIVEQFGDSTWEVMETRVEDLRHIPGLGMKAVQKIRAHHTKQSGPVAQVKNHLIQVGAPPRLAKVIHEAFGERSLEMLRDHPYQVASRVERFGFGTAERCARATGIDPEDEERVDAGVVHTMRSQRLSGHCCMPPDELVREAARSIGVRSQAIDEGLERLVDRGALQHQFGMMFLYGADRVEARVARAVTAMTRPVRAVWEVAPPSYLASEQCEAVAAVARSGVTVLTGGPGTGKSTTVAAVIEMAERSGSSVILCAPTGRAAKRLAEATGRSASTIHRLLRPIPGTSDFHHDESNPLPAGLLVVDEVSMVDIDLADALFAALTREHRLLLVGDADQLPSVGPGNVLEDLITAADHGANISVVRLGQVFRQAQGSSIVTNAHRLLAGDDLVSDDPSLREDGQFYILDARTPAEAHRKIVLMASVRVPAAYNIHPKEVQVLAPMHKGEAGTEAFNARLQTRYGGRDRQMFWGRGKRGFTVGDRVMQTRNDYDRNVFNGDIGTVLDFDETFLTVDFDGAEQRYKRFDVANLQLAYAMTVHKSQGGEFPAVLVPVLREHRMMNRNLLYTAITRARELCVLVGHREAIRRAVRTGGTRRWTGLAQRLTSSD